MFRSVPKPIAGSPALLNLGCGGNRYAGWCNADFYVFNPRAVPPDWMLDLRYPLHCPNDVWDGVFSEHALEHLYPVDAIRLVTEIFRTMKPGAVFRCVVPDLDKYLAFEGVFGEKWRSQAEAIWSLTSNWGHMSTWNAELLIRILQEAGFIDIQKCEFMQGRDERLLKDMPERAWESLYVEARKPGA